MDPFRLRPMAAGDRSELADLICLSTNFWYRTHGCSDIFPGGPASTEVFFDVYQALDPGCGVVAERTGTGRLIGSCFVHPRETHVSLGILNVHPSYFGQGVGRGVVRHVTDFADRYNKPVRLVCSAMNLDSCSLYSQAGFVPRRVYQDMFLAVPETGLSRPPSEKGDSPLLCEAPGGRAPTRSVGRRQMGTVPFFRATVAGIRDATPGDVEAIGRLEMELCGIRRDQDFRYFIENRDGFWHVSVCAGQDGGLQGFMASCGHPGCNMIGPGLAHTPDQAAGLLWAELDRHRGRQPVFVVPADCPELVRQAYGWGARNCELHFHQVRGVCPPFAGVNLPTYLPETA